MLYGIFFLINFYLLPIEVKPKPREITWSEHQKLTWEDFQGTPDSTYRGYYASVNIRIDVKAYCQYDKLQYTVRTVLNPQESWTKNRESESLLRHEQLHYDVSELYTRKIRREFKKIERQCHFRNFPIRELTEKLLEQWDKEQIRIDRETDHGRFQIAEVNWERKISSELAALQDYK
jgi:hypothetical protein